VPELMSRRDALRARLLFSQNELRIGKRSSPEKCTRTRTDILFRLMRSLSPSRFRVCSQDFWNVGYSFAANLTFRLQTVDNGANCNVT
jgi:hypothetical protein